MKFRTTAALAALCAPMIAAGAASAQGVTWNYGVDVTSNYITEGVSQTDGGVAIQPWIEASVGNFYFGTWMSNVDINMSGGANDDSWETDVFAGYRNDISDRLSYDVGYVRYIYNRAGSSYGELTGSLNFAATDNLDLTAYVAYDPTSKNWHYRGDVEVAVATNLSVGAHYGHSDGYDHDYWGVGSTYAFNDAMAVNVSYNGSDTKDAGWAAMMSLAF
ncbi:MAG: hypothetical protein GY883_08875 [Shimia sp.]|nr:hypothetical protein [Shimia sp.]